MAIATLGGLTEKARRSLVEMARVCMGRADGQDAAYRPPSAASQPVVQQQQQQQQHQQQQLRQSKPDAD